MSKTVSVEDMVDEIAETFNTFAKATDVVVEQVIEETCKEVVEELKNSSPKDTGHYAKSWRYGRNPYRRNSRKSKIIYNEDYRLTHLLEYGHQKRGGGKTQAYPHIKPAEDSIYGKVRKKLKERMNRL